MADENAPTTVVPRLKTRYETEIRPALMKQFGYGNLWEAPRLVKVSVNMGVSDGREDIKNVEQAVKELAMIIGQRAAITRARRSIAAFGLRTGMPVGCKATLRGTRMYEFVDRLFNVCLPRIRDFRGLSPHAFDGRGSYTIGIKDHLIFPELGYDDVAKTRGMDITIVTTARTDEEAAALLREMGLPLAGA
jgi:large subunit ribosomal protein L5